MGWCRWHRAGHALLLLPWTAAFGHCAALRLPALPSPTGAGRICIAHDGPDAPDPDQAPPKAGAGMARHDAPEVFGDIEQANPYAREARGGSST